MLLILFLMNKNYITYSFIFLAVVCQFVNGQTKQKDSVKYINSFEKIPINNLWIITNNPAAISNNDFEKLGNVSVGYNTKKGDYYRYNQPESINSILFSAEGYTKPNKITFYGKMDYYNAREKNLNWNNVSFISSNNPFILADSIGGDYDNEIFTLTGKMASQFGENKSNWGISIKYKVGNKVDQTDPRPEIQSQRISIRPGIILAIKNWEFGVNGYYESFKEDTDITVVDHYISYRYFRFMGFGIYSGISDDYFERVYKGYNYGVALQTKYSRHSLKNILELKITNEYERAHEGSLSTRFLAGDYNGTIINIKDRLQIRKNNLIHTFHFNGELRLIKGTWYDQNQVTGDDGTIYWDVYNKSVKYKNVLVNANLEYSLTKEKDNLINHVFFGKLDIKGEMCDFYPDKFLNNYYNLTSTIGYHKNWFSKTFQIALKFNLGYKFNLNKEFYAKDIEFLETITYPEYYYNITNQIKFNNEIKIGFNKLLKVPILPYMAVSSDFVYCKDNNYNYYNNDYRVLGNIKIGIIF